MKEQKSNGKRCLPLPDIYTPIDKTSPVDYNRGNPEAFWRNGGGNSRQQLPGERRQIACSVVLLLLRVCCGSVIRPWRYYCVKACIKGG